MYQYRSQLGVTLAVLRVTLFRGDRRAVTSVEYAMIAGIVVVAIVLGLPTIGPHLAVTFNSVASEL